MERSRALFSRQNFSIKFAKRKPDLRIFCVHIMNRKHHLEHKLHASVFEMAKNAFWLIFSNFEKMAGKFVFLIVCNSECLELKKHISKTILAEKQNLHLQWDILCPLGSRGNG